MKEKELLETLSIYNNQVQSAQRELNIAKKKFVEAESNLIALKIKYDNFKEFFREWKNSTPKYEPTLRDLDIEKFREDHPELVEWAKDRDKKK